MARPEDLLLAFLYDSRRESRSVTQRDLCRFLSLSQPSVSRILNRLRADGSVQTARSGMWSGRNPEQVYTLSDAGLQRAPAAVTRLLEMPSSAEGYSVRDLVDLNVGVPVLDLALASFKGIELDPTDPQGGIDRLNLERGVAPLPPGHGRRSGHPSSETALGASPALIGRGAERFEIFTHLRGLVATPPRGGSLLLLGTAGVGKTRLLQFAREVARGRHLPVLESHVVAGKGPSLSPLAGLLFGSDGTRSWSLSLPRSGGRSSIVSRLLDALRAVETLASVSPQVVLLDDLHRAPRETVQFFHLLSRAIRQRNLPILVFAAGRDEPPEALQNGFLGLVEEAGRAGTGSVRVLPVRPLTVGEARRLAGQVRAGRIAGRPGDRSIGEVLRRARGNPLFIVEGIRDLAEREQIREGEEGAPPTSVRERRRSEVPVPLSLHRLLRDRLDLLPSRERAVLSVVSVLGEEFDVEPLLQVGAAHRLGNSTQLMHALRQLEERYRYLERRDRRHYAFAHPLVFLTVRETFPDSAAWSARFARWWEGHRSNDLSALARLSHDARDPRRGIGWVDRAIDRALETHAWGAVSELLHWRRDLTGQLSTAKRGPMDRDWEVLRQMWHNGAARETHDILIEYLELPLPAPRRVEAEILLVNALAAVDPGEARRRLGRLEQERSRAGPRSRSERGQLAAARAFQEIQAGQWIAAESTARTALGLLGERNDPETRAWALYSWSVALLHLYRLQEASEVCEEGRALAGRNDLRSLLALAADTEARIHLIGGDPQGALPLLRQGEVYAREIDSSVQIARILANRSLAEIQLRHWESARGTTDELRELSDRLDLSVHAAWTDYRYGQIAIGERRWPDARPHLLAAAAEFDRMGLTVSRDLARIQLAVVAGEMGEPREALERVDELESQVALTDADERPALAGIRGRMNELLGQAPVAQVEFRKLLDESERTGNRLGQAEALVALARLETAHGSARSALAFTRLSRTLFADLGVRAPAEETSLTDDVRPETRTKGAEPLRP